MMTSCFTTEQINKINSIVKEIEDLTDVEKLFLYLRLPCGLAGIGDEIEARSKSSNPPPRLNGNIFTRKLDQETTQTYTWILSHLEVDQNVSLPKQEVYDEYKSFCQANKFEPLCVADFGKAMKHTFPCIKPRRLGHRGNSRYCYSGLRKKYKIMPPSWPEMSEEPAPSGCTVTTSKHPIQQVTHEGSGNSLTMIRDGKLEQACASEARTCEDQTSHHIKNGNEMMRIHVDQKQCLEPHQAKMFINQNSDIVQSRRGLSKEGPNSTVPNNMNSIAPNEPMISYNQPYFNYNYSQTVHQPGSPDDDDYQHNYQHKDGPINRQFMGKPSVQVPTTTGVTCNHLCQSQQHQHQHQSQPNVHPNAIQVGYGRVEPINSSTTTTSMVSTSATTNHHSHDPMLTQTTFCLDNQGPSSSSSTSTNTMGTCMSLMSRLSGAPHMDSYASPFQSPASTPYPSISSNCMNHDSQDYFSCDPMQHYTNS